MRELDTMKYVVHNNEVYGANEILLVTHESDTHWGYKIRGMVGYTLVPGAAEMYNSISISNDFETLNKRAGYYDQVDDLSSFQKQFFIKGVFNV